MNPSLEQLHDIALPDPVSWMPQTAGWWILLALVLAISVRQVVAARRRWKENRYRRLALRELDRIDAGLDSPAARADLPALVKKTALARWPRETVASLSGQEWLRFLDESYGERAFTEGPGRLLPDLAYATADTVPAESVRQLSAVIRDWIRRHRVRV
jgi:hypothetical protein